MNSKRDNYNAATDTIMNIKISNASIMKKMGCSRPTVYRLATFFKEKGILVSLKEAEEGPNNYVMVIANIKNLKQYSKKKLSTGVSQRDGGVSQRDKGGITKRPNNITNNKINNNNYKGSYFFKGEVEMHNLDEAKLQLSDKIDIMISLDELPIKYKKEDLMVEVEFHLTDWLHDLMRGANIALDLILRSEWDVPLKLRTKRNEEALAREREADIEKRIHADEYNKSKAAGRSAWQLMQVSLPDLVIKNKDK
jgi:hypothetical protein